MVNVDAQGNEIGKLFVGGLDQATNNDSLKVYFSQFGEVEESLVMMDNRTNRSRGFGYVKFKDPNSIDLVFDIKSHIVDHKEVDPKLSNINMKGKNRRKLKIFVGGIAIEHNEDILRKYFSQFGMVTDVNLLSYPNKPRHRGFAFVGFEDEEVTKKLIDMHFVNIEGKQVEIKAMEPQTGIRHSMMMPSPHQNMSNRFPSSLRGPRNGKSGAFSYNTSDTSFYGGWNQWATGNSYGSSAATAFPHQNGVAHQFNPNHQSGNIWNNASGHWNESMHHMDQRHHHQSAAAAAAWAANQQDSLAHHHQNGWSGQNASNSSTLWNVSNSHPNFSALTNSSRMLGSSPLQTNWSALCQALPQTGRGDASPHHHGATAASQSVPGWGSANHHQAAASANSNSAAASMTSQNLAALLALTSRTAAASHNTGWNAQAGPGQTQNAQHDNPLASTQPPEAAYLTGI